MRWLAATILTMAITAAIMAAAWQTAGVVWAMPATRARLSIDDGFVAGTSPAPRTPTPTASPAPAATATPNPPSGEPVRTDIFFDQKWRTSSASVATDADGGIHIAGYYYQSYRSGPTSAFYRYCPAACDNPDNWERVALLDMVNEVQLALTPDGRPRLLIRATRDKQDGDEYYYAECNADCTKPAGWKSVEVQKGGSTYLYQLYDDDQPQRSFALDPQGRPRFLYLDSNYWIEPDRYGTYYKYCDVDCTDVDNWGEVLIGRYDDSVYDYEMFEYPSLVFTRQGQPRVLAAYIDFDQADQETPLLHYLQCDAGCADVDNWDRVDLWPRGQGPEPGWDLALDAQDRPRIAYFPAALEAGGGEQLYYGLCNADCTDGESWQLVNLELGEGNGGDPDIVFDPDGFPRIVYVSHSGGAVGLAECLAACDTTAAEWDTILLDSNTELENDWAVPLAPICDGGLWNFWTPSLVYDPAGNLRIVSDVTYHGYCWWNTDYDEWVESYQFSLIQRSVRGVFIDWP